jgi:hypothetical protein
MSKPTFTRPVSRFVLAVLVISFLSVPLAYASENSWSKTYGGPYGDKAYVVVKTQDGGYAMGGTTNSFGSGIVNAWLVKTDAEGNVQWNETYSGLGQAFADGLIQTSDGGFALTGYSYSLDGGLYVWLAKTNSEGVLSWNQTYPDVGTSIAYGLVQTSDGGLALVGSSNSVGSGQTDGWIIKTSSTGTQDWYKTYGGAGNDALYSIVQTSDGGYAVSGETESYGNGLSNIWLIKTDSLGEPRWNQTYGGLVNYISNALIKASDGGYALVGTSKESAGDDFLLIKTDSAGVEQWSQTYDQQNVDDALSGIQTNDGGYAIVGVSNASDPVYAKAWLVKTSSEGILEWSRTYGGSAQNVLGSMAQTSDNGFILAGYTNSTGSGQEDFWLVKTDADGVAPTPTPSAGPTLTPLTTSPGPSGTEPPQNSSFTILYVGIAIVVVVVVVGVVALQIQKRRNSRPQTYYHTRRTNK